MNAVIKNRFRIMWADRASFFLFLLIGVVMGIVVPIVTKSSDSSNNTAILAVFLFLRQFVPSSIAFEKENTTLESLLSSRVKLSSVILGNVVLNILLAMVYLVVCIGFSFVASLFLNNGYALDWHLILLNFVWICGACALGTYFSAISVDNRAATSKMNFVSFPFLLILEVYSVILLMSDLIPSWFWRVVTACAFLLPVVVIFVTIMLVKMLKYETVLVSRADIRQNKGKEHYSVAAAKGDFDAVFNHESKILFSQWFLMLSLVVGAIAPAILYFCLYFLSTFDGNPPIVSFSLPVIIIGLMLPRIPMNMAALSVVGEKVYKTGESLISTSVDIRKAFYAKCAFPIVVGFIATIISVVLTLLTANILNITHDGTGILLFESYEWLLIFLTSFFVEIIMIGLTCYFSFKMKVPRNGTIVSSLLSFAPAGVYAFACYMLPESYKLWFVVGITIVFGVLSFLIYRAMFSKLTHSAVMELL